MPIVLSRRDAIITAFAAALASVGVADLGRFAMADEALGVDDFIALSASLTEVAPSLLERDVAVVLLGAFMAAGYGDGLKRLHADAASDVELGNAVVAAWYSGVYLTKEGEVVATFNDALVWGALDFTKPPGNCGGETGYWSKPA